MKMTSITFSIIEKDNGELSETERSLVVQSIQATDCSYSPYSNFAVGAAAELANGEIVCGSNQENAAYPSGMCAERTAVFYANSRYPGVPIRRICISARDASGEITKNPITPCGACRQVLLESETRFDTEIAIMLHGRSKTIFVDSVKDLMPLWFGAEQLK